MGKANVSRLPLYEFAYAGQEKAPYSPHGVCGRHSLGRSEKWLLAQHVTPAISTILTPCQSFPNSSTSPESLCSVPCRNAARQGGGIWLRLRRRSWDCGRGRGGIPLL